MVKRWGKEAVALLFAANQFFAKVRFLIAAIFLEMNVLEGRILAHPSAHRPRLKNYPHELSTMLGKMNSDNYF